MLRVIPTMMRVVVDHDGQQRRRRSTGPRFAESAGRANPSVGFN
jgi:hypothetical protein